jgi:YVTN family beta-propeller protein
MPILTSPAWTKRHTLITGSAIVLAAAAGSVLAFAGGSSAHQAAAVHPVVKSAGNPSAKSASLAASTCTGPTGTAFIAEPGYSAFDAINTANCEFIQDYNVDDPQVPGDSGDYNYSSSPQGVALHGTTLYFTDTAQNNVSVIDAATLTAKNYNPAETDIHVGWDPTGLAATPDGSQVWVADSGPQTDSRLAEISVISTSSNTVTATLHLNSSPKQIAFSPSGATAYVTTADGLLVFSTANDHLIAAVPGLGDLQGIVVSPDGSKVYVTSTSQNVVDVISTAGYPRVTSKIAVGDLPWGLALTSSGGTLYVADPDSNQISVISTASGTVTSTITLAGGPDVLALTADGSQLWVTGITSANLTVISTSTGAVVGTTNLGGDGANSGDGNDPSGIVLTTGTISGES